MCERRYTEDTIKALQEIANEEPEMKVVYIVEAGDELFDAVVDHVAAQPTVQHLRLLVGLMTKFRSRGVYIGECFIEAIRESVTDQQTKRLIRLQRATDQALMDAYGRYRQGKLEGAVNWTHLNCVDAALVYSLADGEHYRVEIEEAAPDNEALRDFVRAYLNTAGFGDVVVETEW